MLTNKNISCIIVDDEPIAREVIATHLAKIPSVTIMTSCVNAIEAFNYLREHTVDLIFLDINMPEISGISFAKSINPNIKVIFTTAYRDFAIEGFELQAVDYLLKPISFDRLLKSVNRYFQIHSNTQKHSLKTIDQGTFMFVKSDRKMIKIDFDSILYIESYSDYLKIHLLNETIVTRETISNIDVKLPRHQFIRTHRSYIIAFKKITSFTHEEITIYNKSIPISRSYKKSVLDILDKF